MFWRSLFVVVLTLCFRVNTFSATYYIDFSGGSNSNNGTSNSTPWKSHPYMQNAAGCGGAPHSYSHVNGDRFIFKGGVTWPGSCFPVSPTVGGISGSVDYYGVDVTWFNGGSFTKPIFDGAYVIDSILNLGTLGYITFDTLELKRITSSACTGYGLITGDGAGINHITWNNLYLHGWQTTNANDEAHGGLIISGAVGPQLDSNTFQNGVVENSENSGQSSWGGNNGLAFRFIGKIKNTTIHDVSSAVLFVVDYDGNTMYNVAFPTNTNTQGNDCTNLPNIYHSNGVYLDCETMYQVDGHTCYIRNSIFHDHGGGTNMSYLNGRFSTLFNYNNVYYGNITAQGTVEIEPFDYTTNATSGNYYVYNNVAFMASSPIPNFINVVDHNGAPQPSLIDHRNNQVIGTSVGELGGGGAASITSSNNIIQTLATANAQGYSTTSTHPGQPTMAGGATIGAGFNGSSVLPTTTDILGVSRTVPWDIGPYQFNSTPCTPSKIIFTSQPPSSASLNASLGTVKVSVEDSGGNVCSGDTSSITLSKDGSATWGTLTSSSSLTKTASGGVATWTDLSIITLGGTGSIDATDGSLTSATSNSITITVDNSAPIVGNSGIITTGPTPPSNSVIVNWTKATDSNDAQNTLLYEVCRSSINNIATVGGCEGNGVIVLPFTTDIATFTDGPLDGNTTYFWNVVVRDPAGNKTPSVPTNATTGTCFTSGATWQSEAFATSQMNNVFTLTFDATPSTLANDGVIGFSNVVAAAYVDNAALVRFNDDATLGVFNGTTGSYTHDTTVTYVAGTSYHFRFVLNIPAGTYTVYVTPNGGMETLIANNYVFRTTQFGITALSYLSANSSVASTNICNLIAPVGSSQKPKLFQEIAGK